MIPAKNLHVMPLIEPFNLYEKSPDWASDRDARVVYYAEILENMNLTKSANEYQFELDINQFSTQEEKDKHKEVYLIATGTIRYLKAETQIFDGTVLTQEGVLWIPTPESELRIVYPIQCPFLEEIYYSNFAAGTMETAIKAAIIEYYSEGDNNKKEIDALYKVAYPGTQVPELETLAAQLYSAFISETQNLAIPLLGGTKIGELGPAATGNNLLLRLHFNSTRNFLEAAEFDNAEIVKFFEYRQRVFYDNSTEVPDGSQVNYDLCGHPLIALMLAAAQLDQQSADYEEQLQTKALELIYGSKVDVSLLKETIFVNKYPGLSIDYDSCPNILRVPVKISDDELVELQNVLLPQDDASSEEEKLAKTNAAYHYATFTVFNFEEQELFFELAGDVTAILNLEFFITGLEEDTSTETMITVNVYCLQESPIELGKAQFLIRYRNSSGAILKTIDIVVLEYKKFEDFRFLRVSSTDNTGATLEGPAGKYEGMLISGINEYIGKQTNIYFFPRAKPGDETRYNGLVQVTGPMPSVVPVNGTDAQGQVDENTFSDELLRIFAAADTDAPVHYFLIWDYDHVANGFTSMIAPINVVLEEFASLFAGTYPQAAAHEMVHALRFSQNPAPDDIKYITHESNTPEEYLKYLGYGNNLLSNNSAANTQLTYKQSIILNGLIDSE
jgi:hypothetical protein